MSRDTELKKAIIEYAFDHENEFNLLNNTVSHFRQYIYTDSGNHCIGGQKVYEWIMQAVNYLKEV